MPKGASKFELTLSLQEIVVLFFVMVALFTGLLFFGYRVGNAHNQNAVELPSTPVAPAQESPHQQREAPAGVDPEPEIRLENRAPEKLNDPLLAPPKPDNPDRDIRKPLAQSVREEAPHPCKADTYWSFLRKALPSKHRFFERMADWARAAPDESVHGTQRERDQDPRIASDSTLFEDPADTSEPTGCEPPMPRAGTRSVAC